MQLVEGSLPCGHWEVVSVGAPVFVESLLESVVESTLDMVVVSAIK